MAGTMVSQHALYKLKIHYLFRCVGTSNCGDAQGLQTALSFFGSFLRIFCRCTLRKGTLEGR